MLDIEFRNLGLEDQRQKMPTSAVFIVSEIMANSASLLDSIVWSSNVRLALVLASKHLTKQPSKLWLYFIERHFLVE